MRRLLRWLGGALGAALLVALALGVWVYLRSEAHLRSFERPAAFAMTVPDDEGARARGQHLVRTRGCAGCHGDQLEGKFNWGYAAAPNLPDYTRRHGVDVFEAALRHGIGADGRAFYSMPSFSFIRLNDADVVDIYAYLRSAPVKPVELPQSSLPWSIRYDLARGNDRAIAGFLPQVPALIHANGANDALRRGEYFAMTTCIECHGFNLKGESPFGPTAGTSLVVIAGYDEPAFLRLMRTGIAIGDRELPRMSRVARRRFAGMTDQEVHDLYVYLRATVAAAAP